MQKQIAIINQRYGAEVNGGSEYYTKKLAEHLNEIYDVEVLTTTALDYDTWRPYYEAGEQTVDGVKVRRFHVKRKRVKNRFLIVNKLIVKFPFLKGMLEAIWLREQGPYCPELISFLQKSKNDYDVFIFVTYLYYTTAAGLPKVKDKAILVPTAHDEYCIHFDMYRQIFEEPKGIAYLTQEEKLFVERKFEVARISGVVAGAGVEVGEQVNEDLFKTKYQITSDYIIYVGRVDTSKGCDVLFQYFSDYKKKHSGKLKLIVIGKMMMPQPPNEDILCKGFLNEEEKYSAIAGAQILVMPSAYESLSLAVLEAMALGVPVMVNGRSEVLKAHCERSGAGMWYIDQNEFESCLEQMSKKETYKNMSSLARQYVRETYSWDKTVEKYRDLIEG